MDLGAILIISGLCLNLVGVILISISGLFNPNPYSHLFHLWWKVDTDELSDKDYEQVDISEFYRPKLLDDPETKKQYRKQFRYVLRLSFGVVAIVLGLFLQLIGSLSNIFELKAILPAFVALSGSGDNG